MQHPKFFVVCNPSAPYASRDAVIRLLRELFYIHPQNSCQPSHLEPLRVVYGGTLSTSDRTLISIFRLFENHEKLSCTSLLSTWSSSGDARSGDALGAVLGLDAAKVFHTCLNYPRELKFNLEHEYHEASGLKEELYDPFFLNLIFSRVVSGNSLVSALSWVQFFRTNIVSVVIRSLSSKDDAFREQALFNLSGLWKILEVRERVQKPREYVLIVLFPVGGYARETSCYLYPESTARSYPCTYGWGQPPEASYVRDPNIVSCNTRDFLSVQLHLSPHRPILVTTGRVGCSGCSHVPWDALFRF